MKFERGPDNASRGIMESVAYYYLDKPQSAAFQLGDADSLTPPPDPLEEISLMNCVLNSERLGDYFGAENRIAEFLETHPQTPAKDILSLRLLAYRERRGDKNVIGEYKKMVQSPDVSKQAVEQAKLLSWLHENSANALLASFCNSRVTVYLDGKKIMQADNPEQLIVAPINVNKGTHALAVSATWSREEPWVYLCLRTAKGDIPTGLGWKRTRQPGKDWEKVDYDDSAWETVDRISRDIPVFPYLKVIPNAFVGMQSAGGGMNMAEWNDKRDTIYFRKKFKIE